MGHDQLFKEFLREFFQEFLELFYPETAHFTNLPCLCDRKESQKQPIFASAAQTGYH